MSISKSDSKNLLILSDAHLTSEDESNPCPTEESLINILEYCRVHSIQILFIGDLFDYWMEYPGMIPPVASAFRKSLTRFVDQISNESSSPYTSPDSLSPQSTTPNLSSSVTMITGNHDNWTRNYFESIGISVIHEELLLNLGGKRILFLHGDGLKKPLFRFQRPLSHRLLRHPLFVRTYQWLLPEHTGLRLMKWFSRYSRKHNRSNPERLNSVAKRWITEELADIVITGHDHIARKLDVANGIYLNSGCFNTDRTAIFYTNGDFNLVKWEHDRFVSYV